MAIDLSDPNLVDPTNPSTARFANLDWDDPKPEPKDKPTPVVPAAPPTQLPLKPTITTTAVTLRAPNADNVARAIRDQYLAEQVAGHKLKETVVPFGSPVVEMGVQNARIKRLEFENMGLAPIVLEQFANSIDAEVRTDVKVDATTLRFDQWGRLGRGGKALPLSPQGFKRLANALEIKGASYLSDSVPREVRDDLMNLVHFPSAKEVDGRAYNAMVTEWEKDKRRAARTGRSEPPRPVPPLKNREVLIRSRLKSPDLAEPHIYAVTGAAYTPFDAHRVARKVIGALPPGARATVKRCGEKVTIDVVFHSTVDGANYVAGEIFRVAMRVTLSDAGDGAIKVSTVIWRNLCLNLIVIDENVVGRASRRHVGTTNDIAAVVSNGVKASFNALKPFIEQWNTATVENVIEKYGLGSPGEVITALVHNSLADVPGASSDEKIQRILKAWEREPGYTKASIVNAISRAAHESSWESPWTTEALEEEAGKLLYQKNWNVFLTPEQQEYAKSIGA